MNILRIRASFLLLGLASCAAPAEDRVAEDVFIEEIESRDGRDDGAVDSTDADAADADRDADAEVLETSDIIDELTDSEIDDSGDVAPDSDDTGGDTPLDDAVDVNEIESDLTSGDAGDVSGDEGETSDDVVDTGEVTDVATDPDAPADLASDAEELDEVGAEVDEEDASDTDSTGECGDAVCGEDENCLTCAADCGSCPACGDSLCDFGETCESCADDCGGCAPLVEFTADFRETFDGPLVAGSSARLRYDLDRLTTCRGMTMGQPAWSIQVFYKFGATDEPQVLTPWERVGSELIEREVEFNIPSGATEMWMWAQINDIYGCVDYDSNFAANYHFPVFSRETLTANLGYVGGFQFVRGDTTGLSNQGERDPAYYFSEYRESGILYWVQIEIWAADITDRAYLNEDERKLVADSALRVEVLSDAIYAGSPGGPMGISRLEYVGRNGNNFVYRWLPASLAQLPVCCGQLADGAYEYVFSAQNFLSTNAWRYGQIEGRNRIFVLGQEQNCALFPFNPPAGCP